MCYSRIEKAFLESVITEITPTYKQMLPLTVYTDCNRTSPGKH